MVPSATIQQLVLPFAKSEREEKKRRRELGS